MVPPNKLQKNTCANRVSSEIPDKTPGRFEMRCVLKNYGRTFDILSLFRPVKRTSPPSFPQPFPQLCGKETKNLKHHLKLYVYNVLEEISNLETGLRLTQQILKRKEKSTEKTGGVTLKLKPLNCIISDEKCINFTVDL